jgi:type IV secretory pathway VirD2 relaxase
LTSQALDTQQINGQQQFIKVQHILTQDGGELISVKWIRDGNDNKQNDGEYYSHMFVKVKEVSTQKEDRILKENKKVMKFDFERGKQQLVEYFNSDLDRATEYSLEYIKM